MIRQFESLMVRTMLEPLVVCLQLFAWYVLIHGHHSPGGGFQGGVLLACSFMLPLMVLGGQRPRLALSERGALVLAASGVLIYAAFGLVPMLLGGTMLDYAQLPLPGLSDAFRRNLGILGIEFGVMLGVAGSAVSIFYSLNADLGTDSR